MLGQLRVHKWFWERVMGRFHLNLAWKEMPDRTLPWVVLSSGEQSWDLPRDHFGCGSLSSSDPQTMAGLE